MALKGDRQVNPYAQRLDFFMNEVAERGGIVSISTGGSGIALDQSAGLVTYSTSSSGAVPLGMLIEDMVDKDLTRTHLNLHKAETQKGSKVLVCRQGWFVTNFVVGTPSAGNGAYLNSSGYISATNGGVAATPRIGQWLSSKDEDGYAKIELNLPLAG